MRNRRVQRISCRRSSSRRKSASSTVQETPISITAITGQDLEDSRYQRHPVDRAVGSRRIDANERPRTDRARDAGHDLIGRQFIDGRVLSGRYPADRAGFGSQNGKVVIDPNLYDLNRVEVLRGPQGTLYGSGSMGGTIKLVPNAPNPNAFDASGQVILGDTDGGSFNHGENAMVNLPLVNDSLALRVVGSQEHSERLDRSHRDRRTWISPLRARRHTGTPASGVIHDPRQCRSRAGRAGLQRVNDEDLTAVQRRGPVEADRSAVHHAFVSVSEDHPGRSESHRQSIRGRTRTISRTTCPEPFSDRSTSAASMFSTTSMPLTSARRLPTGP